MATAMVSGLVVIVCVLTCSFYYSFCVRSMKLTEVISQDAVCHNLSILRNAAQAAR
jgi:hypothetical protein